MRVPTRPTKRSLAIVAAGAVLAACGLVGWGILSGDSGVCGNAQDVSGLAVTRVAPGPWKHLRFTFPAKVTVNEAREARTVALAVCALPAMPSGPMSCGTSAFGGSYRLDFTANGNRLPAVWLTSVCDKVTGAGGARWTAPTPGFWHVLGTAMGLLRANQNTFWEPTGD